MRQVQGAFRLRRFPQLLDFGETSPKPWAALPPAHGVGGLKVQPFDLITDQPYVRVGRPEVHVDLVGGGD